MDVRRAFSITDTDADEMRRLTRSLLRDSVLNHFDDQLLRVAFKNLSEHEETYLILLKDDDRVWGFALAMRNSSKCMFDVMKKLLWHSPAATIQTGLMMMLQTRTMLTMTLPESRSMAELHLLAVDVARQNNGHGSRLLNGLKECLREESVTDMKVKTLESDTLANRFYQKHLFQNRGQVVWNGKIFNRYMLNLTETKLADL